MDIPKEEMTATVYRDDLRYFHHYCEKHQRTEADVFSEMIESLGEETYYESEEDIEECFDMIQLLIRHIHRLKNRE